MERDKYKILISNDDGFEAKGINELIKYLLPLGEILVMAPEIENSGKSTAITANKPIEYSLVCKEEGVTIYKCTGTPADCIKLARFEFPDFLPDVIIGGINHGNNSGVSVHYSGTMGVVIEGCLRGIPSIAYSIDSHNPEANFLPASTYIYNITKKVLENKLPENVCLNVNFPDTDEYRGVKVCRQAMGKWEGEWDKRIHPKGNNYFWLIGSYVDREPDDKYTDYWALKNNYVAIAPIKVDMTDYGAIETLNTWGLNNL